MAQIKIAFLGVEDYPQVLRLFRQLHKIHSDLRPDFYLASDTPITQEGYIEIFEDPENRVIGAMDGEKLVGMCFLFWRERKNPLCVPRKLAYLDDICVDEDYRKQGIGEMVCQEAFRIAREKKAVGAELSVWDCNQGAVAFYRKLGFTNRTLNLELSLN